MSTVRPRRAGLGVQLGEQRALEGGDDQQHQVGAGGARLEELVAGHDEVLAQQRGRDGGPDGAQVLEAAAEAALAR